MYKTEIRVFTRRTEYTPEDELAFIGAPPKILPTHKARISVSITFTWDRARGVRLAKAWAKRFSDVKIGGPAFGSSATEFTPGRFIKHKYFFSSRGCPRKCPWCYIWRREGTVRELQPHQDECFSLEDCNLLACSDSHIKAVFKGLASYPNPAISALDARLIKPWHFDLLEKLNVEHVTWACDFPGADIYLRRIYPFVSRKPKTWRECCVLIGNDTYAAGIKQIDRVKNVGFEPAVMIYQGDNFRHYSKRWLDLQIKYPRHQGDSVQRQEPDGEVIDLSKQSALQKG
jgi:hypothetical protein